MSPHLFDGPTQNPRVDGSGQGDLMKATPVLTTHTRDGAGLHPARGTRSAWLGLVTRARQRDRVYSAHENGPHAGSSRGNRSHYSGGGPAR